MRLNKNIGKALLEARLRLKMPLDVVIESLKDEGLKYNKGNLSRIERQIISCRADLLAALCKIYEIDANDVLYDQAKKTKNK
jgi:hypothetical protein